MPPYIFYLEKLCSSFLNIHQWVEVAELGNKALASHSVSKLHICRRSLRYSCEQKKTFYLELEIYFLETTRGGKD